MEHTKPLVCLKRASFHLALALSLAVSMARLAAAEPTKELLIAALFDESLATPDLDANGDMHLSVADVLLLPADLRTPTPRPTTTVTSTPLPSATRRPSLTRTPLPTFTPTETLPPTDTPTETLVPTVTPTETPNGLIFDGNIADLVPHQVGDELIYQVTLVGSTPTETVTVISSDANGFVVDLTRAGVHEQQNYRDTGNTLLYSGVLNLVRNARTTCNPTLIRMVTPMFVGDFSRSESRCEIRLLPAGTFAGTFDVVETFEPIEVRESVTVPAGTYGPVVHIRQTSNLGEEVNEVDIFPGIGVVRRTTTSITGPRLYELVDGTVNGQSVKR